MASSVNISLSSAQQLFGSSRRTSAYFTPYDSPQSSTLDTLIAAGKNAKSTTDSSSSSKGVLSLSQYVLNLLQGNEGNKSDTAAIISFFSGYSENGRKSEKNSLFTNVLTSRVQSRSISSALNGESRKTLDDVLQPTEQQAVITLYNNGSLKPKTPQTSLVGSGTSFIA